MQGMAPSVRVPHGGGVLWNPGFVAPRFSRRMRCRMLGNAPPGSRRRRNKGVSEPTTSDSCPARLGETGAGAERKRPTPTLSQGATRIRRGSGCKAARDATPGLKMTRDRESTRDYGTRTSGCPDVTPPRRKLIRGPRAEWTGHSTGRLATVEDRFLISAGVG